MIFGFPAGLFLLLGIPVIVLLHLFRQERRREVVSSLLLWREISDQSSRRIRPRLLQNIHLMLQVLAVALAALALAQPVLLQDGLSGVNHLVIAVDTSASMQAVHEDRSVFERAVADAIFVTERGSNARITVIDAGPNPSVLIGPTNDHQSVISALQRMRPSGGITNRPALSTLIGGLTRGETARTVFITDAAGAALERSDPLLSPETRVREIGTVGSNQAITSFELRPLPDGSAIESLIRVANFSPEPAGVSLHVGIDGEQVATRNLELAPDEERALSLQLPRSEGALFSAQLTDHTDPLTVDNAAWAAASGDRPVRVQLATRGNLFLESFLSVFPNVELTMTDAVENPQDYDVIIIDSLPPPARLTGNIITIGTALPDGAFTPIEPLPVEREISVVPHEITEDLGFTGLQVEEAISGALVPRAQPLIRAGDRTLMFAYRGPNLNQVGFLFRLRDSDLPLKASFPVLMRNILAWLAPTGTAGEVGYHRAGDTVPLYVPPGESVVVTLPDGTPERFTPRVSPFEFSQTEQVGVYSVIGESFTSRFAVSLASGEESDLSPSQTPSRAALDESGTTGTGQETSGTDIWHWLALAATLALTIDWLIWARRT